MMNDDIDEDWSNHEDDDIEENTLEPEINDEVAPPPRRTTQQKHRPISKRTR